jgi:hypothetical protein
MTFQPENEKLIKNAKENLHKNFELLINGLIS